MAFVIRFSDLPLRELSKLRAFEQRKITDAIRTHLSDTPDTETRNRKLLRDEIKADFPFTPPLWELRVGEFRVFYDVDRPTMSVNIRSIRRKPPERTTEEVLNENNRD
jgi:mRNA-degrading endonuclease RelE of RelBE toxin-antitoxin system